MTIKEIYQKLVRAKRPIDFFEALTTEDELKKLYRECSKKIHPDVAPVPEKYEALQAFPLLVELYESAKTQLIDGTYNLTDFIDIYKTFKVMFSFDINGKKYDFYEFLFEGEVANIYRGICDEQLVYLKLARDEDDNELLKKEFETLSNVVHHSLPIVREFITINGCSAIVMDEIKGERLIDIMERYPDGIPSRHLVWIMERLFSVVGYLHSNFVVHGNISPENIIINKENHNVSLTGFSFHIPEANKDESKYIVKNEDYSAPEISKNLTVNPKTDIYSLGKLAVYMIGGDVKTSGMPIVSPPEIREFIRNMININPDLRSNDSWKLWDDWRKLRQKLYGDIQFIEFK